ncbi:MAG: hypothetical protein QW251_04030 [Desulfurococcaceae archaeon]
MRIDVYSFEPPNKTAYVWGVVFEEDRIVAFLFWVAEDEIYVTAGSHEFMRVSKDFQDEFEQVFGDLLMGLKQEGEFKGFRIQLIGVVPNGIPSSAIVITRENKERVYVLLLEDMGFAIYGAKDEEDVRNITKELRLFLSGIRRVKDDSQIH